MSAPPSPCSEGIDARRLWTQKEAAAYLVMSTRWLRDSNVPKILIPGNGSKGKPAIRYEKGAIDEWLDAHRTYRRYQ